jgi:PAS domain S-box-containing protein
MMVEERHQSALQRLAAHHAVTLALVEADDLRDAFPRVLGALGGTLGWDAAIAWRLDGSGALRADACWQRPSSSQRPAAPTAGGMSHPDAILERWEPGLALATEAQARAEPVWMREGVAEEAALSTAAEVHSAVAFPAFAGTKLVAVIELLGFRSEPPDLSVAETLASLGQQIGQHAERLQGREAIRAGDARKAQIVEASLDCIVSMDHEGKITEFNPAAERTFGYSRAAAIGRSMASLIIPPSQREHHARGLAHYLATGEGPIVGRRIETTAVRADGTEFAVELSVIRIGSGDPPSFTGFLRDISERARLRTSEERLRTLLEASPEDPAQLKDAAGRWLEANRAALELFGLVDVDYRGKTDAELAMVSRRHAEVLPGCAITDEMAWARGARSRMEENLRDADGTIRTFDVIKVPIFDAQGRRNVLVILTRDISARKQAEAERARLLEEAQRAIQVRDDFLLVASHELRTPCTSLTLAVQGLVRYADASAFRGMTDKHLQLMLGACDRQIRHLNQLVDRLLDVARLQSGRLRLELEMLDLASLAHDVLASMGDQAARARCSLELVGAERPVMGRWDRARLQQVLTNLLGNAFKYGAGKPVAVRIESTPATATLSVRDAGIGIAPEDLLRVFEPFERAVPAKDFAGFGLGLFIVRQIVEAHGGTMRIESSPGAGSMFLADLPREGP